MRIAHCELKQETGHAAGLRLLSELYREETGEALPEIRRTERGKPYFPDSPYYFSISHTKNHCFCILSRRPCAIDAEEIGRRVPEKLGEKILSSTESTQIVETVDKNEALLRFWVLKEAAAKLSGQGLRGYPNDSHFSLNDPRIRILHGCYVAIFEENEESLCCLTPTPI